jgi:LuxR family transcriptional regulator, maltose regulon positive regulatory protein
VNVDDISRTLKPVPEPESSTPVRSPFVLLESKLRGPIRRRVGVPRTGLVDRLTTTTAAPIVGIFAGPGYGKTTLMAQWADADERPFAWVSLGERDNDPVVLLSYIAEALHRVEPIPLAVFEALSAPGAGIEAVLVPRLAAALAARTTPSVLVLDDVHEIQNRACLDAIGTLILNVPVGSQVAIAGRAEPALPMARLRVQGEALDIGPLDLAFSAREAEALLRGAGVHLPEADVVGLLGQTEGWPVGLYLAALSVKAGGGAPAAAGFAGDDRLVADYLRAEVLARLPSRITSFLTHTSVLEELSGPLCDAILEQTGSAQTLASLAQQNLLVVPLDRHEEWYRYHHLFRDLLRAELGRREPSLVPELCRRAAQWCEDNGRLEAALDYAQAAGDTGHAARLFASLAEIAYSSGRLATVRRWLEWFEQDESVEQHPVVALVGAWVLVLVGEAESAARLAAAAEGGLRDELLADGVTPAQAIVPLLRVLMCRQGMAAMVDDVRLCLELTPEASPQRCTALLLSGVANLLAGDDGAADADFAAAVEVDQQMGAADVESLIAALAERSLLAAARSDWQAAETFAHQARSHVQKHRLDDYPTSAIVYAASARVALHQGDPIAARSDLVRIQRLRPHLTYAIPWFAVQVRLQLARAYLALAEPAGARTVLWEIATIFRRRPDLGVLRRQLDELKTRVEEVPVTAPGMSTLTSAELRLLPLMSTHLTFPEIAERFYLSPHTIKAQAMSVYRKLGVSSRDDAVTRSRQLHLLES